MLPHRHLPTQLPADLMAEALRLLATGEKADRLAAAQLLTRGYLEDEERRVAASGEPPPEPDEEE